MRFDLPTRRLQFLAIVVGAMPIAWLAVAALRDELGANPVEHLTHVTGKCALRFLLVSLAVTPFRRLFGWSWLAPMRRTFGLVSFSYACLHFLIYLGLEHAFVWEQIVEDVFEHRYVTAGFAALLCLAPLAATSTRVMMRRLGWRWNLLHRLAYLAAVLAVIHYLWLVKADFFDPLVHAAVLGLLLGMGLWHRLGIFPASRH